MATATELQAVLDQTKARAKGILARARSKEDDIIASLVGGLTAAAAGYGRGRWADNYGNGLVLGVPAELVGGVMLSGASVMGYVRHPAAKAAGDALLCVYAFQMGLGKGLEADLADKAKGK